MQYQLKLYQSDMEFEPIEINPSDIRTLYTYRIRNDKIKSVSKRLCIPSKTIKWSVEHVPYEYIIVKQKKDNVLEYGWGAYRYYELDRYKSPGIILSFSEDRNKILMIYAEYLENLAKSYHDDYLKVIANISEGRA